MIGKFARRVLVSLVVVSLSSVARAQMGGTEEMGSNRLVSIGVGGGVSVPISDAGDALKTGFNAQGFVRFNLHQLPIVPRVDLTFSKFDIDEVKLATPGSSGTGQIFAGLANVQYSLTHSGAVRPYIVAGLGAYNTKTDINGVPSVTGESSTDFGINAGAGFVFKLGSMISGYVEGRIDNVYSNKGMIGADQVQVVPVTFGLVF